jgi:hypothetical protein
MAIKTKLNLLGFDLTNKEDNKIPVSKDAYYKSYIGVGNDKISKIIELSENIAKINNEIAKKFNLKQEIKTEKEALKESKDKRSAFILDYVKTEIDKIGGIISDTPRNNLARLEHLRWDTFYLIHGWTKKPKSKIGAENEDTREKDNIGRQNKFTKQHACITTFEELVMLRELQAEKKLGRKPDINNKEDRKAIENADTIYYDFNLMDELIIRLEAEISDKRITFIDKKGII